MFFVGARSASTVVALLALTAFSAPARADDDQPTEPPPPKSSYLQYGVAFTAELAAQSAFCQDPQLDCVLGSGGGIAGRVGWRSTGALYFGGAYELSKQDPNKLYLLAILQQLRAETRYYFNTAREIEPYASAGLGLAAYGNEWAIDTWGPTAFLAAGAEAQIENGPVVGLALAYRPMYLAELGVSGVNRGPGFAHMIGIDLTLEAKDAL
jgi:hypothetical protein